MLNVDIWVGVLDKHAFDISEFVTTRKAGKLKNLINDIDGNIENWAIGEIITYTVPTQIHTQIYITRREYLKNGIKLTFNTNIQINEKMVDDLRLLYQLEQKYY